MFLLAQIRALPKVEKVRSRSPHEIFRLSFSRGIYNDHDTTSPIVQMTQLRHYDGAVVCTRCQFSCAIAVISI